MSQNQPQTMSYEQIEQHLKSANLEQYDKPQAAGAGADAQQDLASQMQRVCGVFRAVKPILQGIGSIPFLPSNIKSAINTLVSVLSGVCG